MKRYKVYLKHGIMYVDDLEHALKLLEEKNTLRVELVEDF